MKLAQPNDKTTLLLNNAWMPITTITARAAFMHLFKKRISALDKDNNIFHALDSWKELGNFNEDQPFLRSAKEVWPIPTIIVVNSKFFRKPKKLKLSLHDLAKICDYKCQYCFTKFPLRDLTIDHIHPKSKGGEDVHANRVLACRPCNSRKSAISPWFDNDGKIPRPPSIPSLLLSIPDVRKEWEPFVKNI